jgi:polyisoprenoid-binding protein YceI
MSTETSRPEAIPDLNGGRWRIDPERSRVGFATPHFWGLATVEGEFKSYGGTLDLSADPAIELTIVAASVQTGQPKRDRHLRSPDFFDAENHPQIRFASDSAQLDGERLAVRGRLQAAGNSIPLGLEATLRRVGDELEIEAITDVHHRALGITWSPLGIMRSPSKVSVGGRLVRDA